MVSKVTLFIPTHNRHIYLTRILNFYKGAEVNILVCDSTDVPYSNIKNYPNVKYLHYPGLIFTEKMHKAMQQITTPYIAMCGDDDYLILNGVNTCVDFLLENKDYALAMGKMLTFNNVGKTITFAPSFTRKPEFDQEDVKERLIYMMSEYIPFFYAVHRTEVIQHIFKIQAETDLNVSVLSEFFVNLLPTVSGKAKILPLFYAVRDKTVDTRADKEIVWSNSYVDYPMILASKDPVLLGKYDWFLETIADKMVELHKESKEVAKKTVIESMAAYHSYVCQLDDAVEDERKQASAPRKMIHNSDLLQRLQEFYAEHYGAAKIQSVYLRQTKGTKGFPFDGDPTELEDLQSIIDSLNQYYGSKVDVFSRAKRFPMNLIAGTYLDCKIAKNDSQT